MSIRKIAFEEGWQHLEEGIAKLTKILEGHDSRSILTASEVIHFYDCVYMLCVQRPEPCQEVYCRFKMSLDRAISSLDVYQELLPRCSSLSLSDGNVGADPSMDME